MNKAIVSAIAIIVVLCGMAYGQESSGSGASALVVYFSKTGNTQALAEQIHSLVGGDIFQVVTVKKYPDEYRPTTEVARVELDNNERPELAAYVENMDSYNTIFIGFPNWWGTMPMAMYTFLEHYDLSGKTIVPFLTHGGGGLQRCEDDIRRVCANSTVTQPLVVNGSQARTAQSEVAAWLRSMGWNG